MAYPVDIAVVEDVRGGTLETQLEHDAPGTRAAMARLSDSLEAMHQHRRRSFGKISAASGVAAGHSSSCEQIVLGRALGHLADAASRVERMAAPAASWNTPRLNSQPPYSPGRSTASSTASSNPITCFDVEWEHAFMQLRFGNHAAEPGLLPGSAVTAST
jgi:hypothetical protein